MFKICNSCGKQWETREGFLSDPEIEVTGYQTFFSNLKVGLFLFNHSCHTTLSIESELLLDLYKGPFHHDRNPVKGRKCPQKCLTENYLSPCSDTCKCSFISKLLSILKNWEKKPMPA
jgi:hypothetical protein